MIEVIYAVFLAGIIAILTTICGIPVVFRVVKTGRWLSKLILSFVTGFIILSLSGIAANALSLDPFLAETGALVICILAIIPLRNTAMTIELDNTDRIVLGLAMAYCVILIAFFNSIIMWMAGDAVAHASIIRMLVDGNPVPVSIYPFGTYWDIYPKAFHFYSLLWAKGSSVLAAVQIIPVVLSTVIPVILYATLRELRQETVALYAFVFACVCFPAHYAYLIWAGYPSIAAEMILIAAILSLIVNWRLVPVFFIGILFTHTRFAGYLVLILVLYWLYLLYESNKNKTRINPGILFATIALAITGFFIVCLLLKVLHPPQFLLSLVSDRTLALEYATRWFWAIIALFGLAVAIIQRKKPYILFGLWLVATGSLFLLVDAGVLPFFEAPDRVLNLTYIPLSVFCAVLLGTITDSIPKSKSVFLSLLLLIGFLSMGAIFYSYAGSWALPKADYDAAAWLHDQNFPDAVCLNLDGPGELVYPLAGITVSNPRLVGNANLGNESFLRSMIDNPDNEDSISLMKKSRYTTILVYISNVSIAKPGFIPPFNVNGWGFEYIIRPERFQSGNYDLIYDKGAKIFRFKK